MASIDGAQLKVFGDRLYKQITDETDAKILTLDKNIYDKVNSIEVDYNTKIVSIWSDDDGLIDLKRQFKEAVKQLSDSVGDIHQSISSIEVRIKEAMGQKVFEEKSTQFADMVGKHLVGLRQNTDTLEEKAKE